MQKGGTTALFSFLSRHPDLFLPAYKEVHYFDDESLDWRRPDHSKLDVILRDRRDGQIAGEATPIYTYWQPSAERIHQYHPAMNLIVLLRNPVERAYSHWAMEFGRGTETFDFATAIRSGRSRLINGQHRVFSYVERGLYSEQISRLKALFPGEQLLFLRTEDLRDHHERTLDRVCDFIGVARFATYPPAANVLPHAPASVPQPAPGDLAYLRDLYRSDTEQAQQMTGLDLSAWLPKNPRT